MRVHRPHELTTRTEQEKPRQRQMQHRKPGPLTGSCALLPLSSDGSTMLPLLIQRRLEYRNVGIMILTGENCVSTIQLFSHCITPVFQSSIVPSLHCSRVSIFYLFC